MSICRHNFHLLLILSTLFISANSWLKCKDTFCGRIREKSENPTNIELDFGPTLKIDSTGVEAKLRINGQPLLKFQLSMIENSIFHFLIDELSSSRYRATDVLVREFQPLKVQPDKTSDNMVTVIHKNNKAIIYKSPFKVEFYNNNSLISVTNWKHRLIFETKAKESAIALDILFPDVEHAYGIPLHADNLTLRNTRLNGNEPYRLYNLGCGNYGVHSTDAQHGSVPVLYAHGTKHSSGIFWLNPSQTWVDISTNLNQVDAYFMSETGVLEMFVLMGPTLPETVMQYAKLTGVASLPPYFALGYHQSRFSNSQYDVIHTGSKFISSDLPLDTVWLDIEYADGRKYFTWNPRRFPEPRVLVQELIRNSQRTVAIINPHFKDDSNYAFDVEAKRKGYYVKYCNGKDYSAESMSGVSSWLDFLNPNARDFYANEYIQLRSIGFSRIHIWNDMNEPIVFNDSLENTLPPDLIHYQNISHRKIHNIYGFYQTMATRTGMLKSNQSSRPFILSRSHFSGSQRYAAVWTGDNHASWEQLQISLPMCLTEALAGISFCGADVGGFEGIPDDELYIRWYQTGAWLPFYRGRYAFYLPPREPYLCANNVKKRIRMALRQRYAHIPLWYTLFREHELTGEPVIRPITYHYPEEKDALSIDDEILVGPNVLVAPVLEASAVNRNIYFPGGESQIWYNINNNYRMYNGVGYQSVPVKLDFIPVFYRAGSIIPRKDQECNSTECLAFGNYTLYIAPDSNGYAYGSLYDDHYDGFDYQLKDYLYITLIFFENILTSKLDKMGIYSNPSHIDKLIILNPPSDIKEAKYISGEVTKVFNDVKYDDHKNCLEITFDTSSNIDPQTEFTIELLTEPSNGVVFKLARWMLIVVTVNIILTKM